jgi:ribosomal protein S13
LESVMSVQAATAGEICDQVVQRQGVAVTELDDEDTEVARAKSRIEHENNISAGLKTHTELTIVRKKGLEAKSAV